LIAALNDSDSLAEVLGAAGEGVAVLTPAVDALLVELGTDTVVSDIR